MAARLSAGSGLDFLEEHCINHEAGGRPDFTVTAEGLPLRQRRYCSSARRLSTAIAYAEYYGVTGEEEHLARARRAYQARQIQPNNGLIEVTARGRGPKTIPEARTGRALGDRMIFLNIISIMRRVDPAHTEVVRPVMPKSAPMLFVDSNTTIRSWAARWSRWRRTARRSCGTPPGAW